MADLHVVVKGTRTIDEFKAVSKDMRDKANKYFYEHMYAYENHDEWREGEPAKAWYDEDGNFIVQYESGEWWHYKETDEGLQWW